MFVFILQLFITLITDVRSAVRKEPDLSQFSELVDRKIGVVIEPLNISYQYSNLTASENTTCALSLHRDNCMNKIIKQSDKLSWNTRICFKWNCNNTEDHVMRVQECWTGSATNPIYLINKNGCSREKTMLSSPKYERNLLTAYSVGWLSVRLVGADTIRLSCSIRLCHRCDPRCSKFTPPLNCGEPEKLLRTPFTIWDDKDYLRNICRPEQVHTSGSSIAYRETVVLTILLVKLNYWI
ncbi:unnamed protein product [Bursaphelenchus xylophilus]|uniref:(pine wood nematode) hypothetical protein n=1 Tax=Bursaphelenchus xylophilus TaxID=6326 RepID=A0A1I7RYY2_BURXY|nr:unnamed protein product [Bursaphelenchus xylophilus]CAG9107043.1 unnamed protein product [Bursaphelenchus xylophilus]